MSRDILYKTLYVLPFLPVLFLDAYRAKYSVRHVPHGSIPLWLPALPASQSDVLNGGKRLTRAVRWSQYGVWHDPAMIRGRKAHKQGTTTRRTTPQPAPTKLCLLSLHPRLLQALVFRSRSIAPLSLFVLPCLLPFAHGPAKRVLGLALGRVVTGHHELRLKA